MSVDSKVRLLHQLRQEDGDLYEHILSIVVRGSQTPEVEVSLEAASVLSKLRPLRTHVDVLGNPLPRHKDQETRQVRWVGHMGQLVRAPDMELPKSPSVRLQHLVDDFSLLEWANIGFGPHTVFQLSLSIKAFAETLPSQAERVRLWGRVSTRSLPYYIIESGSTEDIDASEMLEGRDGCNRLSYWVTQDLEAGSWIPLPQVTCAQIVSCRKFRRTLSGNLQAPVPSYPPFPGNEENLLRALIACIAGATSIAPDGMYEIQEDSDPPVLVAAVLEEGKQASDLLDPAAWRMIDREPNEIGRTTALPPKEDEEPSEAAEVEVPQLLAEVNPEAWVFRVSPGGAGSAATSVVLARSLEWPGATAVASGKRSVCVYVGDGIRRSDRRHEPSLPAPLQREWVPDEEAPALKEQDDPLVDPSVKIPDVEDPPGEEEGELAEEADD